MTKTLILMRHAKSAWDDPLTDDHDRPLEPRGRRAAEALGDWLRDRDLLPDEVLCSSALRTRETLAGLDLGEVATRFESALYHAGDATLMRMLKRAGGERVLLLGHNPGMAIFAERILAAPPSHPRFSDYPTGATLVAEWDIASWTDAGFHRARAVDFVVPRDLTD